MKRHLPKHCYRKGRKGLIYFERGDVLVRMPDDPASVEFARVYAQLRSGRSVLPARRTIKMLIASYVESDRWRELAPNTRRSYMQAFRYIEERAGHLDPAAFTTPDIYAMRDALRATPTTANRRIGAFSVLFIHAMRIGWTKHNPAHKVEPLKGVRPARTPWPVNVIAAFRAEAGPLPLLIFELLLGTGQRIGDVLAMQWGHIDGDGIAVRQSKTGASLFIPFTDRLRRILAATPRRGLHIVTQDDGRPVSYQLAWKHVRAVRDRIGGEAWDMHALRHTAASELAAAGLDDAHIMALTGHQSSGMVRLYAGAAAQRARARKAQAERNRGGT